MIDSIRSASRELVRELGLLQVSSSRFDLTQCHALLELGRHGTLTVAEIGKLLRVDKSTASRAISALSRSGSVEKAHGLNDKRTRSVRLTAKGEEKLSCINCEASSTVSTALSTLSPQEQATIAEGLRLYSRALTRSRIRNEFVIRPIEPSDDAVISQIIRTVMPEYGCDRPGDALNDSDLRAMYNTYHGARSEYFIISRGNHVLGGGGFLPLSGASSEICELRKMYLKSEARGLGLGRTLLRQSLLKAKQKGYKWCYLETTERMPQAIRLYQSEGFLPLDGPWGDNGHAGADKWFAIELTTNLSVSGKSQTGKL
ncbi:MAG: bifunctional helix-turn-helix transcriptional regulator/GNAT family N-acetyltransferase [Bdellovibrionales bacterium]|nr:bifunctional helix-turn-helix transcriptional regulator/GNAT family N-acetyltransferase [Bdellovibrionales bacterium]